MIGLDIPRYLWIYRGEQDSPISLLQSTMDQDQEEDSDDSDDAEVVPPVIDLLGGTEDELATIWEDDKVIKITDDDGKKRWKCKWCSNDFATWNATKAIAHVSRTKGRDVKLCNGRIDEKHKKMYHQLAGRMLKKRERTHERHSDVARSIEQHNSNTAVSLDASRRGGGNVSAKKSRKCEPSPEAASAVSSISKGRGALIQLKIHDGPNPSADSSLTMAISDCIHSLGLPFSVASQPKFRKVIHLAKTVGSGYKPPGRNEVAGPLLKLNYDAYMEKNEQQLLKQADIYGVTLHGDGATVRKKPLTNILAAGVHMPAFVLEIADATGHMEAGGKKDARYVASIFRPHIDRIERQQRWTVDLVAFDGASNVQKGGEILLAAYPRATLIHGAEHVISLFFQDCFQFVELRTLDRIVRGAYRVFGSGSMHGPYATFQKHAKTHNNGKNIGLYKSSDTRMGGHAIAMMRFVRLKRAAQSTVTSAEFLKYKVSA
jgi:hypothetical protein